MPCIWLKSGAVLNIQEEASRDPDFVKYLRTLDLQGGIFRRCYDVR